MAGSTWEDWIWSNGTRIYLYEGVHGWKFQVPGKKDYGADERR